VVVPTVAVLTVAGFQVPVILFVEVVGKTGAVVFCTNGPTCAKAGAIEAVTTAVIFVLLVEIQPPVVTFACA
jgi:hypothetical protein